MDLILVSERGLKCNLSSCFVLAAAVGYVKDAKNVEIKFLVIKLRKNLYLLKHKMMRVMTPYLVIWLKNKKIFIDYKIASWCLK